MNDHLVTIVTFNNSFDAESAKSLLESSGINAYLINSNAARIRPMLALMGGVRLQVVASQAEEATEILRSIYQPQNIQAKPIRCPSCDSKDVIITFRNWWAFLLMIVSLGLFYPSTPYECNVCGFRWRKRIR